MQSRYARKRGFALKLAERPAPGVTLIELVVTISVLAILIALAIPSFTAVINNSRLTTHANQLVSSLHMARSEAVRLNASTRVCRSTDGTTCAGAGQWDRWITVAVGSGQLLGDSSAKPPVRITSGVAEITFRPDGLARDATGALLANDILVCVATTQPPQNRRLVRIGSGSRISTESATGACP